MEIANRQLETSKIVCLAQKSADAVRKQLKDLGMKIRSDIQPLVRQTSVKSGVSTALYDKSIKLGTLILDIMETFSRLEAIGICSVTARRGW